VTDSKKVYTARSDLAGLERTALAAVWSVHDAYPRDLTALLQAISIEPQPHLHHPWYCHRDLALPHAADEKELRIAARLFRKELAEVDARLTFVKVVPVVESRFNRLYDQMRNKSTLLLSETIRLVDAIIRETQEKEIEIYLDKQGARNRYVDHILRFFGSWGELSVLEESDARSAYALTYRGRSVRLYFLVNGETKQLPVALASIVSKYLRELFMLQFNSYWHQFCPDLKPTAGYHKDGVRFLNDLTNLLDERHLPLHAMVRRDQDRYVSR